MKIKTLFILTLFLSIISCNKEDFENQKTPIITIIEALDIEMNQSSFKLKLENKPITEIEIGICWSTTSNPTINNNKIVINNDLLVNPIVTISNLEANTTYYVKSYIISGSEIYYSNELQINTKSLEILCESIHKFDIEYDERAKIVRKTNDGGFIVCGWTNPVFGANVNVFNLVILKYNSNCNLMWQKVIPNHLNVYNLIEDSNGDILLLTQGNGIGYNFPVLIKMNSQGNIIWNYEYIKETYSSLKDIIKTNDGNYLLVGTYANSAFKRFGWLAKINSDGQLIYEKSFPKEEMMIGKSIINGNSVNEFYVVGDLENESTFLYKINSLGNIIWRKKVSTEPTDINRSIIKTIDNKLLISGTTKRMGPNTHNLWLVKLDLDGNIIWENGIGKEHYIFNTDGNDSPTEVIQSESGAIYITGGAGFYPSENSPTLQSNIWLFKINQNNGNIIWSKEFGSNDYYTWDLSYSLTELNNGELVIVGNKEDEEPTTPSMNGDFWIIKLKEN